MRHLLLLSLVIGSSACIEESPLPFVGDCAEYPSQVYDYGEIGIGSCLSGPTALIWKQSSADPDQQWLLVANANPFLDFTGGSVLAIDASALPLDGEDVDVSTVAASALPTPNFPGYMAEVPERDLLLVTNRLTEDARTRVGFDDLYFVDDSDPTALAFAPMGAGGSDHLSLMSDPDPIVYDPASGYAFVANLTSHTISVVDALGEPISVVDATDDHTLSPGRFLDVDDSGSRVEVATLEAVTPETFIDENWSFVYAEGTWRAWIPTASGVKRSSSQDGSSWRSSGFAYEMDPADTDGVIGTFDDPQTFKSNGLLYMSYADASTGTLYLADEGTFLANWAYRADPMLEGRADSWDAVLGGPDVVSSAGLSWLFYDGMDESGEGGIGLATAVSVDAFSRASDEPILGPGNGPHDSVRLADPNVVWDDQADIWLMYYSAWDGSRWTIGRAESEDLYNWTADPDAVFAIEGQDVGSPAVLYGEGQFRMWTVRREAVGWSLGVATSPDGVRWTDQGATLALEGSEGWDEPPGVGIDGTLSRSWGLYGERTGPLGVSIHSGQAVQVSEGFAINLSSGALLSPDGSPAAASHGVQIDAWLPDLGLVYVTMTDADGVRGIGVADYSDGRAQLRDTPVLTGAAGAFDAAGVSHAAVFAVNGGYRMLYAGTDGATTQVGSADSVDGLTWTSQHDVALGLGDSWDSVRVIPGSVVTDSSGYTLWYSGSDDNARSRIGIAQSSDGVSWTRVEGPDDPWIFGTGAPGQIDDSSVRQPYVLVSDGVEHLWYAGSDGDAWRIGYAWREVGSSTWTRAGTDDITRAIVQPYDGNFDADDVYRPVVSQGEDGVYRMLYTGQDGAIPRGGLAEGLQPDRFYRRPASPTPGDRFEFSTRPGSDTPLDAISLERRLDGYATNGQAVSTMALDPARGFLYVASKSANFIYVIDVRDDSTATWTDANYLDFEDILVANADVGATGFRGMVAPAGSNSLYALNGNPESVMIFDLSEITDDDHSDIHPAAVTGYLNAPRSGNYLGGDDAGAPTTVSIGPSQAVVQGNYLYVANFSANSVGVYDLRMGAYGALIREVELVGENPHTLALSPDGRLLAVANYVGEVDGLHTSSTLLVLDADPLSPTWLEPLARIVNR